MDNLTAGIAAAVRADMQAAGMSENGLSGAANIPRVTLRRRLAGTPFTTAELASLGRALDRKPSDWVRAAEASAS